jgi:hypothetical protein
MVDPQFAAQHPDVPWDLIYGMRNRIVHDYFEVDLEVVWRIDSIEGERRRARRAHPARDAVLAHRLDVPRRLRRTRRLSNALSDRGRCGLATARLSSDHDPLVEFHR